MTKYDELQAAMNTGHSIFLRDRQLCWQAAIAVSKSFSNYVGKRITSFFHWRDGSVSEKLDYLKAAYWDETTEPQMVVGLACLVESNSAWNQVGYQLTLTPKGNTIHARIGKTEALLQLTGQTVAYVTPAEEEKMNRALFDDLTKELSIPPNRMIRQGSAKIGFHVGKEEEQSDT